MDSGCPAGNGSDWPWPACCSRTRRSSILDEPTAHLDGETEAALREAFDVAQAGRTTLVIAHRLATVAHADRIVVLQAGRIVESGRPADLAAAGGAYAALLREHPTEELARQATHPDPGWPSPGAPDSSCPSTTA